jgi:hypothetical protein
MRANVNVTFEVSNGGGIIASQVKKTDAYGRIATFVLATNLAYGTYTVRAFADSLRSVSQTIVIDSSSLPTGGGKSGGGGGGCSVAGSGLFALAIVALFSSRYSLFRLK